MTTRRITPNSGAWCVTLLGRIGSALALSGGFAPEAVAAEPQQGPKLNFDNGVRICFVYRKTADQLQTNLSKEATTVLAKSMGNDKPIVLEWDQLLKLRDPPPE